MMPMRTAAVMSVTSAPVNRSSGITICTSRAIIMMICAGIRAKRSWLDSFLMFSRVSIMLMKNRLIAQA